MKKLSKLLITLLVFSSFFPLAASIRNLDSAQKAHIGVFEEISPNLHLDQNPYLTETQQGCNDFCQYDAHRPLYVWYFRARYFSDELGRFVSRDSYAGQDKLGNASHLEYAKRGIFKTPDSFTSEPSICLKKSCHLNTKGVPWQYTDGFGLYGAYFAQKFSLDPTGFATAIVNCTALEKSYARGKCQAKGKILKRCYVIGHTNTVFHFRWVMYTCKKKTMLCTLIDSDSSTYGPYCRAFCKYKCPDGTTKNLSRVGNSCPQTYRF